METQHSATLIEPSRASSFEERWAPPCASAADWTSRGSSHSVQTTLRATAASTETAHTSQWHVGIEPSPRYMCTPYGQAAFVIEDAELMASNMKSATCTARHQQSLL